MKQAQNARKQRGRTAQRKGGKSNGGGNRSENKVRGNPKQLLEKYKTQARDALQAGDRITAEYYLQFADHYQRVLNEMQSNRDQSGEDEGNRRGRGRNQKGRGRGRPEEAGAEDADGNQQEAVDEGSEAVAAEDPGAVDQPVEVHPELDLGSEEKTEKPKRAPRRRRAPKAEKPEAESAPEGDEAA